MSPPDERCPSCGRDTRTYTPLQAEDLSEATAVRIVACVNVLVGVPQQVLEQTTPEEMKGFVLNGIVNKGLNPATYRECVEAMRQVRVMLQKAAPSAVGTDSIVVLTLALAHVQEAT